ncbi:hypothetical protein TNCV_2919461 [Trichonephila clavipes]|nr:hypothetical protein TNCV_2919461 [Trichonephila clavipes]
MISEIREQLAAKKILEYLLKADSIQEEYQSVISVMCKLSEDEESIVRSELVQQIPSIALYCQNNSDLKLVISQQLVPYTVKLLNDSHLSVRKLAQTALLVLLENNLIGQLQLSEWICPLVSQLAMCASNLDEQRIEDVTVMSMMIPLVEQSLALKYFMDPYISLCSDRALGIRTVCAMRFGTLCKIAGTETTESSLLPAFLELCKDVAWGVRKACANVIVDVTNVVSLKTRKEVLAKALLKLLDDSSNYKYSLLKTIVFLRQESDSILKRLTRVKWGCNRDTLNTTYKTYIQPVLNYCYEVLISASENVRKLLDIFHNQALRMITGRVKTTPVLAMQLLCDLQPFTNIIEKNAAILFNRLIRLPNNSFWRDYDSDGGRNLKTQKGFIQCVRENIQYKVINDVPFELLSFANPLDYAILDIRLDLVLNVRKRDLSPTALHAIALETINTRFPPEEWLHIYTEGSLLDFAQGAGIGVFSHFFSFYLHAGPLTTQFDDSTSALQALSNYNENNCLRVQNCRELLGKINGKIVFQWVPSHCGLWGNESADFLAKKGTGILQNFRRDLTLHSAKLEIKRIFRESFCFTASRVARDKPWSTLCKKCHSIPSSPRAAAVAKFRLLTGHDYLCAHLFRFNLVIYLRFV